MKHAQSRWRTVQLRPKHRHGDVFDDIRGSHRGRIRNSEPGHERRYRLGHLARRLATSWLSQRGHWLPSDGSLRRTRRGLTITELIGTAEYRRTTRNSQVVSYWNESWYARNLHTVQTVLDTVTTRLRANTNALDSLCAADDLTSIRHSIDRLANFVTHFDTPMAARIALRWAAWLEHRLLESATHPTG
jgi:hypothetical protein